MRSFDKILATLSLFLCLLGLLILGLNTQIFQASLLATIALGLAPLTFLKPSWGVCLLLFLLPVFGNKPGTLQSQILLVLALSTQVGQSLGSITGKNKIQSLNGLSSAFWYTTISILSLFPISFRIFWDWFKSSQDQISNISLLSWNIGSILISREDGFAYPVLSVIWTILSFSLCFFIAQICRTNSKASMHFCWSLLSGFVISLIVGLMNYYGILNLDSLRGLDPVVNPGGIQYRLQSWFGHSGWYAEYVTMLAPFSLLILTLKFPYWLRVSILLLLLLIGELVLILTFQRGGWLSYPATLLAVWASIYILKRLDSGDKNWASAFKASLLKICVSLPLTILVSFLILQTFGSQFGLDQYSSRFKDITKSSDRTEFIKAGFKLGSLHPILGLGSESFPLQYRREFKADDGKFFGQIDLPLHGSAHNLYAQTFSGKGALGLISLFALILVPIVAAGKFVLNQTGTQNRKQQIVSLACLCSLFACFVYGFVQELFYVQSLQYVFFAVVGIIASQSSTTANQSFYRKNLIIGFIICIFFIIHLIQTNFSSRDYLDSQGCYPIESNTSAESWSWCGIRSSRDISNQIIEKGRLDLQIATNLKPNDKQLLRIEACDQIIFSKVVEAGEKLQVPLENSSFSCRDSKPGHKRIYVNLANYFIPAKLDHKSEDRRVLAMRWLNF